MREPWLAGGPDVDRGGEIERLVQRAALDADHLLSRDRVPHARAARDTEQTIHRAPAVSPPRLALDVPLLEAESALRHTDRDAER